MSGARVVVAVVLLSAGGCSGPAVTGACDAGACAGADSGSPSVPTMSAIRHLVVIVQENHSFDGHFGRYCTAPTGSHPECIDGPACCEAGPVKDPMGYPSTVLDDAANGAYSPNHEQACELDEIDGGKMDRFVSSSVCGSPRNFAYSDPAIVAPYWKLAADGALADRYFQPIAGQTSSNDMFLARAGFVFRDNAVVPASVGAPCDTTPDSATFSDATVGDLLIAAGVPWAFYAEGYQAMKDSQKHKLCPEPPVDCEAGLSLYPCIYDPSDVPFEYYASTRDDPRYMRDLAELDHDLATPGALPSVIYIKALGYRTEHPALKVRLSDGPRFVSDVIARVLAAPTGKDTLVLLTYDESGGYFDHIPPPGISPVDQQPYGPRVPTIAVGRFARHGKISHVQMEHSSIVRFIEWNWLGGVTGQLLTRDAAVANIGSLLDPTATGTPVPEGTR